MKRWTLISTVLLTAMILFALNAQPASAGADTCASPEYWRDVYHLTGEGEASIKVHFVRVAKGKAYFEGPDGAKICVVATSQSLADKKRLVAAELLSVPLEDGSGTKEYRGRSGYILTEELTPARPISGELVWQDDIGIVFQVRDIYEGIFLFDRVLVKEIRLVKSLELSLETTQLSPNGRGHLDLRKQNRGRLLYLPWTEDGSTVLPHEAILIFDPVKKDSAYLYIIVREGPLSTIGMPHEPLCSRVTGRPFNQQCYWPNASIAFVLEYLSGIGSVWNWKFLYAFPQKYP